MVSEEVKKKYMQFQLLQQQLEQVSQHLEMLNQQCVELDESIDAVQQLSETKKNQEILAPIADGIFLKAEIIETNTLIVNVGSNVTAEKTLTQVTHLLSQQKQELVEKIGEADAVMQELTAQAMRIYQEVAQEVGEE